MTRKHVQVQVNEVIPSFDDLLRRLLNEHGELIGGNALAKCLGYRTPRAFQMAAKAERLPIQTFEIDGRRGRFAKTSDLARWLSTLGQKTSNAPSEKGKEVLP